MRNGRTAPIRQTVCLLALLLLAGCTTPTRPPSISDPESPRRDPARSLRHQILNVAERLVGVPYVWGGTSLEGMDCSGLVHYIYRQVGISVPRTAATLYRQGHPLDDVRPGDLLFFKTEPPRISHVGIYIGDGQMIHASSGSRRVRKANINRPYWRKRLVSGATYLSGSLTLADLSANQAPTTHP